MEPKPEFYDWLQRNDPEGSAAYEAADRQAQTKLQDALSAAMDLEFEQLKANERWAMNQAQLWRAEAIKQVDTAAKLRRRLHRLYWTAGTLAALFLWRML